MPRIETRSRRWAALALPVLGFALPGAGAQSSEYLNFAELSAELRAVVDGSPRASLRSLGASREGRNIWIVEIAEPGGPPLRERPGVLVVGNLSGDHLVGSQLALETVRFLVGDQAGEAELGQHVIYVVPRLNPDGAEAMFRGARDGHRLNALPFDADNDGRLDEDGPDDLNGDGVITTMRVADPAGAFLMDPDEPRLMQRADASEGESGTHKIYWEGVDSDGDSFINEDGPGGVDLDRSFQHEYPYWEMDAGANMVSEPEARALMDFVIATRNIAAIITFGHSDNLVTPPNSSGALADAVGIDLHTFADESNADMTSQGIFGAPSQPGGLRLRGAQPGADNNPNSGRRPSTTVHEDDQKYFGKIAEAYEELTGIDEVATNRKAAGAFFQYGYFQFGVPSFSTLGWGLPKPDASPENASTEEASLEEASAREPRDNQGDARILAALEGAGIDAFVPWTPYEHPDLGAVEIGGFRPYAVSNPPPAQLPELGAAHGRFVSRVSSMLSRVRLVETEVTAHGGGVFTVSATVANQGFLPSALRHGVISRSVNPVTVQIQVPTEAILTGAAKTHQIAKLDGSGTRETIKWVVRGSPGSEIEISVRTQKSGSDSATVILR